MDDGLKCMDGGWVEGDRKLGGGWLWEVGGWVEYEWRIDGRCVEDGWRMDGWMHCGLRMVGDWMEEDWCRKVVKQDVTP